MTRPGGAALDALLERRDLDECAAFDLMVSLTDPAMPPAMSGALLAALRIKGATAPEVRGFARAMRELARRPRIPEGTPVVDVVGTGGDGSGSLNLSTGTALLAAACGIRVAKHGNRSVSSRSGSADVLEALGFGLPPDEQAAVACLERSGFTFLFAPHFHPAMKAVAPVRAALGVRTVFNLLGPLASPAQAPYALIGAWSLEIARLMAETLSGMPIARVFVVHSDNGWDEPTPAAAFTLFDVSPGRVIERRRGAADFGLAICAEASLRGGDAAENARRLGAVLRGQDDDGHRDALLLGVALVAEVTGTVADGREGIELARAAIQDGRAARFLDRLVTGSGRGAG